MKKKLLWLPIMFYPILIISAFAMLITAMLWSVFPAHVEYYQDDTNYIEFTCVVEDGKYFTAKENYPQMKSNVFGLWEINSSAVEGTDFWKDVTVGSTVTVISAEAYFWDGYVCPVVGLKINGKAISRKAKPIK